MSEYRIPFHIEEEIMKRLPVKSLIQFRSVSKAWKSLIDSPHFIAAHTLLSHTQPHHLLVSYTNPRCDLYSVTSVDDETLFQQRPVPTYPPSAKHLIHTKVVGSSRGLVCSYGRDRNYVVWNPSIRKSIVVALPTTLYDYQPIVGFGVCRVTTDPKIVAIKQSWEKANIETTYQCEVMVYTLSSGNWRSLSTNLPTKPIRNYHRVATADGFIYWVGGSAGQNIIVSFDVTNETFQMIDLPTTLAPHARWPLISNASLPLISKLRESFAILQYQRGGGYTVWKMEGGVQRSFTKLFTINTRYIIMAFRKSGVPIMLVTDDGESKLVVYEPISEYNVFDISGDPLFFAVESYMETLLLLGRSDCSSY